MRKSEFSQGSRRLTSVKDSQNARKSLATANFSTRKSDFGSGVRQSLLGRNSFCPSTTKTGRKGGYKDPRELQGNKANQRQTCEKIVDFIFENCGLEMNVKQMEKCSVSQYKDIFVRIARLILGVKTTTNLMEEKKTWQDGLLSIMSHLDYPITIKKSSFVNLTMTSIPVALGVLDWLIGYYHLLNTDDNDMIEDIDTFEIFADAFVGKSNGRENVEDEVAERHAEKLDENNDRAELEAELDQIAEKYQNLQEREAYLIETEQKVVQKRKESVEIQKHVDFSQKSVAYNTNLIKDLQLQIDDKKAERADLRKLNDELSEKIGDHATAIDLRNQYKAEEESLKQVIEEKSLFQAQCDALDLPLTKNRRQITDELNKYNQAVINIPMSDCSEISGDFSVSQDLVDNVERLTDRISELISLFKDKKDKLSPIKTAEALQESELKYESDSKDSEIHRLMTEIAEVKELMEEELRKKETSLRKMEDDLVLRKNKLVQLTQNRRDLESKISELTQKLAVGEKQLNEKSFEIFTEKIDKIEEDVMENCMKCLENASNFEKTMKSGVSETLRQTSEFLEAELAKEEEATRQLGETIKKYKS